MKELRTRKVNMMQEGTLIVVIDAGMASPHGCCERINVKHMCLRLF